MEELRLQTKWWGKSEFSDGRKLLPSWKLEGQRLGAGGLLDRQNQWCASLVAVGTTQETWPWAENERKKYFFPPPALQPHLRPSCWLHLAGSHGPSTMQQPSMASLHLGMRILPVIALWFAGRLFTVWATREAFSSLMDPQFPWFLEDAPSHWPSSFSGRFGSYPLLTTLQGCPPLHPPKIKKKKFAKVRESGLDWSIYTFEAQIETSCHCGRWRLELQWPHRGLCQWADVKENTAQWPARRTGLATKLIGPKDWHPSPILLDTA